MKYILFPASALLLIIAGCKNRQKTEAPTQPPQEKKAWFPVADFLKSEIRYVDSLPVGLMMYTHKDKKTDSGYIKLPQFDSLASGFIPVELQPEIFQKDFSESSFLDQTTHISTFMYANTNDTSSLKRVDVMVGEENGFDRVKSIYMELRINKNDSETVKKMYWNTKRNFSITTIAGKTGQPPVASQVKLVWATGE